MMNLTLLTPSKINYDARPSEGLFDLRTPIVLQDHDGAIYGIPAYDGSDGASIPSILPERGAADPAGFFHDFAYRFAGCFRWSSEACAWWWWRLDKAQADEFYRAVAVAFGMHPARARTDWIVLSVWPGTHWIWRRHRRRAKLWTGAEPISPSNINPAPGVTGT